jgi:hypothetical protein
METLRFLKGTGKVFRISVEATNCLFNETLPRFIFHFSRFDLLLLLLLLRLLWFLHVATENQQSHCNSRIVLMVQPQMHIGMS